MGASLEQLRFAPGSTTVTDLPRGGHDADDGPADMLEARDFVARLLAHVPAPECDWGTGRRTPVIGAIPGSELVFEDSPSVNDGIR